MLTFCVNFYATSPDEFGESRPMSPLDLRSLLKDASRVVVTSKDEVRLISLTTFDPTIDPGGYRRQANYKVAHGIILDFDNGELTPEEFEQIFWHDAADEKIAFIICNTFSRCAEQPNRFRVIIPFQSPVYSLAEYQATYDTLVERLERAGYSAGRAKLDATCRSGIQLFRYPCTNRTQKDWAFCRSHGLQRMRDADRYALKPVPAVTRRKMPVEPKPAMKNDPPMDTIDPNSGSIEQLQNEISRMTEGRHRKLFDLAIMLRSQGRGLEEIEKILLQTVGDDQKLQRKVRYILASLRRYDDEAA